MTVKDEISDSLIPTSYSKLLLNGDKYPMYSHMKMNQLAINNGIGRQGDKFVYIIKIWQKVPIFCENSRRSGLKWIFHDNNKNLCSISLILVLISI